MSFLYSYYKCTQKNWDFEQFQTWKFGESETVLQFVLEINTQMSAALNFCNFFPTCMNCYSIAGWVENLQF